MTDKTKEFLERLAKVGERLKKDISGAKAMREKAQNLKNDVIEFTDKFKANKNLNE
jgi:hypothetical protein